MIQENQILQETELLEIIENQLEDDNPIKVKETLMRLMMTGTSREDAVAMMACAMSIEVFDVMKKEGQFDLKRYTDHLNQLPNLSFMEGK
ncbi:hypothetical protein [Vibrio sagamiensis]|uniref:Uncharacterized protein n=1 Tax=Vibrio sagamiensis NBRC 104589 TaxID=1219064 RepID=A0A511QII0_9VIBR|nr:hypothetical protein [Vibrio sagamiensis]GEM77125.1 hypothetical protein VSA01S_32370 [Vibrio sagamiensis NBRC 104589]